MMKAGKKSALVIGSGFSGLSAACYLAKDGYQVTVIEKNEQIGGRAREWEQDGFKFDMGPSWYWMPDVFDDFFKDFGKRTSDYYELIRLSPSYRVFFPDGICHDIPANMQELESLFEQLETGGAKKLRHFLNDAEQKYEAGMRDLVQKPGLSLLEFANLKVLKGLFQLDLLTPFSKFVRKYFSHPHLIQLLEFPVLFLGARPSEIPALYSLMNYADMQLGTWYPNGGMHQIILAMKKLALELGVEIRTGEEIKRFEMHDQSIQTAFTQSGRYEYDEIVAACDYQHLEQNLLEKKYRKYSSEYWDKRTLAPSCLIFYVGLNKRIQGLLHHNLFFDTDFGIHAEEIYTNPKWPENPLFYVSAPGKTDSSCAPEGCENLFILIPVAPGLQENPEIQEHYFDMVIKRLEERTGEAIRQQIILRRDYAYSNFVSDYHSFKGNAYGLANTLNQTAILKPKMQSNKVKNLTYTGQLTVPGPGVPPSLISGKIAAGLIHKKNQSHA